MAQSSRAACIAALGAADIPCATPKAFFRSPEHPRARAFLGEILAHH
jgi:hypothetical protein